MKKVVFLFIVFLLQGCWFAPDTVYVEFDSSNKTIELLSEDYYIKSVTIAEYVPKEGYIQLIDSTKVVLTQIGQRGTQKLNLLQNDEHYIAEGNDINELLNKKHIRFEVNVEKFENEKEGNEMDTKEIVFVNKEIVGKARYNSKIP